MSFSGFLKMKNKNKTQSTRDELRAMRDAMGWSNYQLAEAAGLSGEAVVRRYLSGQTDIGTTKADAMRAAFHRLGPTRPIKPLRPCSALTTPATPTGRPCDARSGGVQSGHAATRERLAMLEQQS